MLKKFLKYKFAGLALIFLFWNIIALVTSTILFVQFADTYPDSTWLGFFYRQAPIWYLWMFFTPIILWVNTLIQQKSWSNWQSLGIHIIMASLMLVIYSIIIGLYVMDLNQKLSFAPKVVYAAAARNFAINFATNCLIYLLIVLTGKGLQWYRTLAHTKEEKLKLQLHNNVLHTQLVEAQLQTLTLQLRPHFLFNTLHSIASLVRIQQNEGAIQMIADFSELLRLTIQQGGENFATLQNEIEFIKKYLNIEKTRLQDRLEVGFQIDEEVQEALVPSLILQPFVENAIKHGISQMTQKGLIMINVFHINQEIRIRLKDNGPGLPPDWNADDSQGLGIANSFERLKTVYGQNFQLTFENVEDGGTLVCLQIPTHLPVQTSRPHVND